MALNTWASKNIGADADISRTPSSGGGGGGNLPSMQEVGISLDTENGKAVLSITYYQAYVLMSRGICPYFVPSEEVADASPFSKNTVYICATVDLVDYGASTYIARFDSVPYSSQKESRVGSGDSFISFDATGPK